MPMKIPDNCSRCGGSHDELALNKLTRSFAPPEAGGVEWTHWSTCPTTGEPILVVVGVGANADALPDSMPIPSGTQYFEDVVEWCYWRFDSLRSIDAATGIGAMTERDAYKSVLRAFYATWRLDRALAELVSQCPLGYVDGKVIATSSTNDADVVAWLQKLDQHLGVRKAAVES